MTNEERLHEALSAIMPAFHTVIDGQPQSAAVFRLQAVRRTFESDVCINAVDIFQVYIYQKTYEYTKLVSIIKSVLDAGFNIETRGAQFIEDVYYRDEITVTRRSDAW